MNKESLLAKLTLADGSHMYVLLSQDIDEINRYLAYLQSRTVNGCYLVHRPDLTQKLQYVLEGTSYKLKETLEKTGQLCKTEAICSLCGEPVFYSADDQQQRTACGCTIYIFNPHPIGLLHSLDTDAWADMVGIATDTIQSWLEHN